LGKRKFVGDEFDEAERELRRSGGKLLEALAWHAEDAGRCDGFCGECITPTSKRQSQQIIMKHKAGYLPPTIQQHLVSLDAAARDDEQTVGMIVFNEERLPSINQAAAGLCTERLKCCRPQCAAHPGGALL
jgi:hypothetical protein